MPSHLLYKGSYDYSPHRFDAQRQNISNIADNTRLLHLLDYLDVPDDFLEEVSLGAIDGTWTESSARIMRDFSMEANQLQKLAHFRETGTDWRCPCCCNDKYGTVRKSRRKDTFNISFVGHHDHIADLTGRFTFPTTVVCEYCNQLDNTLKRMIAPYVESHWCQSSADELCDPASISSKVFKDFSFSVADLNAVIAGNASYDLQILDPNLIKHAAEIYNQKMKDGLAAYVRKYGRSGEKLVYGNKQMVELATLLNRDAAFLTSCAHLLEPGRLDVSGKTFNTRGANTFEVFHDANETALVDSVRSFDDSLKAEIATYLTHLSENSSLYSDFSGFLWQLERMGVKMSVSRGSQFLEWSFIVDKAVFHEVEIGIGGKHFYMSGILPTCVEGAIKRHLMEINQDSCVLTSMAVRDDIESTVQEGLSYLRA